MMLAADVLILGGTREARLLAETLAPLCPVTSSLAGRTGDPAPLQGRVRIGGFGGVDGLIAYLKAERPTHMIDATHPYAARMGRNAILAAAAQGIPLLRLDRPAWQRKEGDHWLEFPDLESLARGLPMLGRHALVTLGGADLATLSLAQGMRLTLRTIDSPPVMPDHPDCTLLQARGPFDFGGEVALLSRLGIDILVSRNAGGNATGAKIEAARHLGLPVAMLARPERMAAERVGTVEEAIVWLRRSAGPGKTAG